VHYIILDLEWNQPLSRRMPQYQRFGSLLMFDLIQIGAFKLNHKRQMVGSFNQFIRPGLYKKLHPRITRITGIAQEDLYSAPGFEEAFDRFISWCGEDYILATWGKDDVSVLQQNMNYYLEDNREMPPVYDLQQLYKTLEGSGNSVKTGLQSAMERYHITYSPEHPFHSAVDDAYYTARVFQRFPEPEALKNYPITAKPPAPQTASKNAKADDLRFDNLQDASQSNAAKNPNCPVCGKRIQIPEGYVPLKNTLWRALADCQEHGLIFVDLILARNADGQQRVRRLASLSELQNPAYISTKHLQWANKIKALKKKEKIT
jgi:inhibitor of KinA sporulation pathway (predicted exonuclease)